MEWAKRSSGQRRIRASADRRCVQRLGVSDQQSQARSMGMTQPVQRPRGCLMMQVLQQRLAQHRRDPDPPSLAAGHHPPNAVPRPQATTCSDRGHRLAAEVEMAADQSLSSCKGLQSSSTRSSAVPRRHRSAEASDKRYRRDPPMNQHAVHPDASVSPPAQHQPGTAGTTTRSAIGPSTAAQAAATAAPLARSANHA